MSFTLDTSQFQNAIRFSINEVGRDLPDVLNRSGRNVAIKSIQKTPRADSAKISAVTDDQIRARIFKRARAKGIKLKTADIPALIKKERNRMKSARGYTAGPGYDKAVRAFGGRGVKRQAGFEKSEAARGKGTKATGLHLVAELVNTAPAAEKIGTEALQGAIDAVAVDLVEYGYKKLDKTFRKVNA